MTRRMVLLCHANVARSPSAELIARTLAGSHDDWEFTSAGTHARVGRRLDPTLGDALRSRGIATWSHRARQADESLLRDADLIVAFESGQRDWIAQHYPARLRATTTIRRAAAALNSAEALDDPIDLLAADSAPFGPSDDFDDPIGLGPVAADAAVRDIDGLMRAILPPIGALPASALPAAAEPRPTRMSARRATSRAGDRQLV